MLPMPIVSISLLRGKAPAYRRAIADAVHEALVDVIGIARDDRFQLINQLDVDDLIYDPNYLGTERSNDLVVIQITLCKGRSRDVRLALHREITARLVANPGMRSEDVLVVLLENDYVDWSLRRGHRLPMVFQEVFDEL
jgi:phenylpyruvate tautomerase PptA (4-oxalocrotonate tautomerase family)